MSSPYIEKSKHGEFTAAIENHFFGGAKPDLTGKSPGGSPAWNSPKGSLSFNAPGQSLPSGTGVNYNPQPGHTTNQDPFSLADGFPGG